MAVKPSGRDAALLLDMLLAAQDAADFVSGSDEAAFMASRLHQSAVIRALEVLGEAAGKVSAGLRAAHPEIAWREMTAMRHRLIDGHVAFTGIIAVPDATRESRSGRLTRGDGDI